jgi:hypothetical protein
MIVNPENLLPPMFRDTLAKTLEVSAEKRPDASQLLQHPFFAIAEPLCTLAPLIKFDHCRAPDSAEHVNDSDARWLCLPVLRSPQGGSMNFHRRLCPMVASREVTIINL